MLLAIIRGMLTLPYALMRTSNLPVSIRLSKVASTFYANLAVLLYIYTLVARSSVYK